LAAAMLSQVQTLQKFAFAEKSLAQIYDEQYSDDNENWRRTVSAITQIKSLCDANGIKAVALIMPSSYDLNPAGGFAPHYAKVEKVMGDLGIPVSRVGDTLWPRYGADYRATWVARDDPHFNAGVHAIMGDILFSFLKDLGALK
jgi:hypothetical protein